MGSNGTKFKDNFLRLISKIMKSKHKNPTKEISLEENKRLLDSLSELVDIDDDINVQNLDRKVLSKKFSLKPSKLKLFKSLYTLITSTDITTKNLDKLYKNIVLQINKLPELNSMFSTKELIGQINKIKKEKRKYTSSKVKSNTTNKRTSHAVEQNSDEKEDSEKFKNLEKLRQKEAFSAESLKQILDLEIETLRCANRIIEESGQDLGKIDYESIPSIKNCSQFLESSDSKNLSEKQFDKFANNMKKEVEHALLEKHKRFKVPPKRDIIYEIIGMFSNEDPLSQDAKTKLKELLKSANFSSNPVQNIEKAITHSQDNYLIKLFQNTKPKIEEFFRRLNLKKLLNYKECYVLAVSKNSNAWKTLSKKVEIKVGKNKKPMNVEFKSVPASSMGIFTHLNEGEGISSGDNSIEHLANLWTTNVRSGDKTLFSGLRFRNTRGNETATKELILAAAVNQYGLEKVQNLSEGSILNVKLGNVQLMSPTSKATSFISSDKDKSFKQMKALKKLVNKPFDIPILDKNKNIKKIKLCLTDVILSNFGMNTQHFMAGGKLVKSSKKQNSEAIIQLVGKNIFKSIEKAFKTYRRSISKKGKDDGTKGYILNNCFTDKMKENKVKGATMGKVGESLEELYQKRKDVSSEEKREIDLTVKKIINLTKQILDIWFTTNGQGISTNPAAIQTRIALLMSLLGYTTTFNCKSGKDRTGEMAAEISDLALSIEANDDGSVPDPYKAPTEAEKLQLATVFDATQSSEIAQANTGFKGLKVSYSGMVNRTGRIRGASKLSKITSKT